MLKSALRLSLGVLLILAASAILLLTDKSGQRSSSTRSDENASQPARTAAVALFQHVSQPILEEGAQGLIAGLRAAGYSDGSTIRMRRFNAEGDSATANTIARELVQGQYDLIVTLSTPSLQAVAGANREARVHHIFGMVSDPVASGVGIARDDPMKHPAYLTGIGTMQPVAEAFRLARRVAPRLAKVGVAWNPSEANSEACTKIARTICRELGIELLEANVDNSAGVREAVASVIGRGAQAIWIGGDVTVLASIESVIGPARSAHVPVFSNIPGCSQRGSLFDLGADYNRVGNKVAELAARVLGGESPATMPILYEVPSELWLNLAAFKTTSDGWSLPPEIEAQADVTVEPPGQPIRRKPRTSLAKTQPSAARPTRQWKIGLISAVDAKVVDDAFAGLRRGLKDAGFANGREFVIRYRNAQGDIATLNSICDEMSGDDTDLVVALTTTALQAALRKIDHKPLLFGVVLDPIAAGAGRSQTEHRANVTGVALEFPYAAVVQAIREVLPKARKIGTLFTPSELNSALAKQRFENVIRAEGLTLESKPINAISEAGDAALSLCQSKIDVFCQLSDGLSTGSFPAIARACESTSTPLLSFASGSIKMGAILTVGSDYEDNGREVGHLVAEIMGGKSPATIPFRGSARVFRTVNLDLAKRYGVKIPDSWIKKADIVLPQPPGAPPNDASN
jgi:ABC-type uncharacterized transport system substrate-binding protein